MEKYIFKGLTDHAIQYLDEGDIFDLTQMIGSKVTFSNKVSYADGGRLVNMPDGELTHIDFLNLEIINPKLNF